ncbi:MAG TPA: xanthine dehydrogenase family protein molybdopterin-binding subunit [Geminicoccaceae bacterium]|nr:xanthine dehydrogenase family protein molybdopterin-binding subunit [Geminicoccaceae bacterium]
MAKFGVGQPVRRVEDQRFVTGAGRYADDINVAGQVYGYVLRSPEAHARIRSIDAEAAKAAPGVLAVITGADLVAAGAGNGLPCMIPMENRDGSQGVHKERPILCTEEVRHVGDPVAFVVAETLAEARDASEQIMVDYQSLPAVTETATAAASGQPLAHHDVPSNLAFDWEYGDRAAVEDALAKAARVVELRIVNNRLISNPIEPRAGLAEFADGKFTLQTCSQGVWLLRDPIAGAILKTEPQNLRVLTPDVGGGFGTKAFPYPEYAMLAFAARQVGRPVKWTGERSETFVSDVMGRDHVTTARLALDADHRIQGLAVDTAANLGAYTNMFGPFIPTGAALKVLPGVYDVKRLVYRVKGVLTNTTPVDAYRGAGRPESIYLMERLMDAAAREVGLDPAEFRRRNLVEAGAMPFRSAAGETYDSGEFGKVMDQAMAAADWPGFEQRRAEAARRGLRRGIGMCYYIESTMGDQFELASIRFEDDGSVSVAVGTQSNGQGHETAFAQVLSDRLGVPFEKIRLVQGDSERLPKGGGTGGSRSLTAAGLAIRDASDKVVERGKQFAAQELETAVADVEFVRADGAFQVVGTDRRIGIMELAQKARASTSPPEGLTGGLDADAEATIEAWTFPNGCHIAEVEVDPETGVTTIVRYTAVDDFGVVMNPMLVAGQVHGGVVQGIGQALYEEAVYDDSGQLLSGSFMDYCMPRADGVPAIEVSTLEVPCKNNPMGVKGCGEAGSVASPAAVINAIIDALADLGVRAIDMPATPQKVWRLIQEHGQPVAAE